MKKTNKVISLVLALVMVLSILVVIPTASAASTEYIILEVTGIDISNTTDLKLNYAFYFSGGTNYIAYAKIDDGSYVQIATATSGTAWQYVTDKSISGTGNKLSLKFTYKSNKSNNAFYLDEIYVTGTKSSGSGETTLYFGQEMELFWNPARRFAVFGTPPVASLLVPLERGQCFFCALKLLYRVVSPF